MKQTMVIEYKDKLGHTICKKVQYGTNAGVKQYASTYCVYDDLEIWWWLFRPKERKSSESSSD